MGILQKLFASREGKTRKSIASNLNWKIDDGWLTIPTLPEFFGKSCESSNGIWTIAWCERNLSTAQRPQESGGSVLLLDNQTGKIRQHIALERPFGAVVSDTGGFAVHDGLLGGGLQGKILGYSVDGVVLFARKYLANVWTIVISPCGRYVAAQTLNSPDDGYLFEVLDLLERKTQFSVHPETGLVDDYRFEVGSQGLQRVFVVHKDLGAFAYDAKGVFLQSFEFREALLTKGDFSQKIRAAQDLLTADASVEAARRTVQITNDALIEGALAQSSWAAIAHRLKGEAHERLGEPLAAIASYERALIADPKAGIRRALKRL